MRPDEVRRAQKVEARIRAGDRAGALAEIRPLAHPPQRRRPEPVEQLCLAVVLSLPFRCERLNVEAMPVRDCLVRRSRQWPSGGGKGSPAPAATACQGCPVGLSFAVRLPSFRPPPSTLAPEVLPRSQAMARRARVLAGLGPEEPVSLDPLRVASGMTPDDDGREYTP